ncbi:hypothetical protein ABVT39_013516 [Epinephelus coioides]
MQEDSASLKHPVTAFQISDLCNISILPLVDCDRQQPNAPRRYNIRQLRQEETRRKRTREEREKESSCCANCLICDPINSEFIKVPYCFFPNYCSCDHVAVVTSDY